MVWNRGDDDAHRLIDRFSEWMKGSKKGSAVNAPPEKLQEAFNGQMKHEIDENFYKGDRESWLNLSKDEALGEIRYHVEKLETAVEMHDEDQIKENAADVANCCLIFLDVMGYIEPMPEPEPPPPAKPKNTAQDYSYDWS